LILDKFADLDFKSIIRYKPIIRRKFAAIDIDITIQPLGANDTIIYWLLLRMLVSVLLRRHTKFKGDSYLIKRTIKSNHTVYVILQSESGSRKGLIGYDGQQYLCKLIKIIEVQICLWIKWIRNFYSWVSDHYAEATDAFSFRMKLANSPWNFISRILSNSFMERLQWYKSFNFGNSAMVSSIATAFFQSIRNLKWKIWKIFMWDIFKARF